MRTIRVDLEHLMVQRARPDADLPAHWKGQRYPVFGNVDRQRRAIPVQAARTDREMRFVRLQIGAPALGHRPARMSAPVKRDVDSAVIVRIAASGPGVIG